MVVGTGSYKDSNEAYPLDKATLRSIALRSLVSGVSYNAETGESMGWLWALLPGLKKIHSDEEDLALCMGHHLEFVDTGNMFSSLAMGVVLALEQSKADLESIRSVRTSVAAACKGLGRVLVTCFAIPLLASIILAFHSLGTIGAAFYALALAIATVVLRIQLIYFGYSHATRVTEKILRHKDHFTYACRCAGVFMIGALAVLHGDGFFADMNMLKAGSWTLGQGFNGVAPGMCGLFVTWLAYHLLAKKNWSLLKCFILIVGIALAFGLLSLLLGSYAI